MDIDKIDVFEDQLVRLQEIVEALEKDNLTLADGLSLYKEGLNLSKKCRIQLDQARNEVKIITEKGLESFESVDKVAD